MLREKDERPLPYRERHNPLNYLYRLRISGDFPGLLVVVAITLLLSQVVTGSMFAGGVLLIVAVGVALAIHFLAGR